MRCMFWPLYAGYEIFCHAVTTLLVAEKCVRHVSFQRSATTQCRRWLERSSSDKNCASPIKIHLMDVLFGDMSMYGWRFCIKFKIDCKEYNTIVWKWGKLRKSHTDRFFTANRPASPRSRQTHVVLAIITHAIEYEYICTVSIFLS